MRGMGRIFRMKGSKNLWIAYNCRGKEYRESCRSPELKEAKKLLKLRLRETGADVLALKAFVGPKQERFTVGQLLDTLEADFRLREIKSLKQTKWHLNMVREAFGHLRAVDLTTEMVTKYIEDRLAEEQAPATLNKRTGLLAAAFRLAIRRRQLSSMPEIPKLREDNARQGFFASEDFFAVLSHLEDQDLADFLQWFFWTGMRPGEIRSLTWQAFDSETWTLRGIIERRCRARRFGCHLIFHRDGNVIGTFLKRWKSACISAGVSGRIPYDLRRTAVRNMIRAGVPERVAMSISGHKTRAVFDRYNIVSENDLREAMRKTSAYVDGLPKKEIAAELPKRNAPVSVIPIPIDQRPALERVK